MCCTTSVWEVSIKQANGRLDAPHDLVSAVADEFTILAMTAGRVMTAGRLPAHHAGSSNRMLIAQAMLEGLTPAGIDRRFCDYDVPLLSAG